MADLEVFYPNMDGQGYTYCCAENLNYVCHLHSGLECTYVIDGKLKVQIDDEDYELHRGDFCLIMPYIRHSFATRKYSKTFGFSLLPDHIDGYSGCFGGDYIISPPVIRAGQYSHHVKTLLDLVQAKDTYNSNALTHVGLLNTIVGYLFDVTPPCEKENKETSQEDLVLTYLYQHWDKPVTLLQAAEDLNLSQYNLSRICNQQIGIGFNAYLRSVRVAAAKRRLVFTELSMPQIAKEIGFESCRTFNRIFKEETGMTPRDYRSMHKGSTVLNHRPLKAAKSTGQKKAPPGQGQLLL